MFEAPGELRSTKNEQAIDKILLFCGSVFDGLVEYCFKRLGDRFKTERI
jgi:hypothetical protein